METLLKTAQKASGAQKEYEEIHIEKTKRSCGLCENYSSSKAAEKNLTAVISCEGACLRGEISRRAANKLCFENSEVNTARVCLGSAFTKDAGQRNMIRAAERVIILEGCFIECGSRMIKAVLPELDPEIIYVDRYSNFDKNLFAINEATEDELIKFSQEAADNIKKIVFTR